MATKRSVNKTQAVRDYLKAHPAATNTEIATALNKRRIKITLGYVGNIRTKIYKTIVPPEKPPDRLTLEQLRIIAQAIKRYGIDDPLT